MSNAQTAIQEKAKQAVQKSSAIATANKQQSTLSVVKSFIEKDDVKKRFQDILGKKAGQFLASITSLVSSSTSYNDVDPNTIMSSAIVAATLDLPINSNLGFAYIIPYNSKQGKKAQFQMGYKGFIQLALRSGQFQTINATEVYEGEVVGLNRLTGEIKLDEEKKKSQKVVGYASFFRLINGFEKTLYMSVDSLQEHGKKFSKSYSKDESLWKKDFHSMAMKTVLKLLLSKYGILSVDMQKAIEVDQGVVSNDGATVEYVDAIESIKDRKEGYLNLINDANDKEHIEKLKVEFDLAQQSGEITLDDFNELMTELNEKEKSLIS